METDAVTQDGDDVVVRVLVVPNASADKVVGRHGDRIRVRIAAPPERGRANDALCKLLRSATGARRADVVAGVTNRNKTVRLAGVSKADVDRVLAGDV